MMKGKPTHKRKHDRKLCSLNVRYSPLVNAYTTPVDFGSVQAVDISRQGVCILMDQEIEVPKLVQLQIEIPDRLPMFLLAKTIHCKKKPHDPLYKIGLKFVGLLPNDFDEILEGEKSSDPTS